MIRLFLILILSLSTLVGSVFATCNNESTIDKSDFRLDVGCMSPVSQDSTNPIPSEGGIDVLTALIGRIVDLMLFIVPLIAAVSFLVAGYYYIFSAGDAEKVSKAKTIIKWNIIAITIALLSYGIVQFIANLFS